MGQGEGVQMKRFVAVRIVPKLKAEFAQRIQAVQLRVHVGNFPAVNIKTSAGAAAFERKESALVRGRSKKG